MHTTSLSPRLVFMDTTKREKDAIGKLLTWVSGLVSLVIIVPVGLYGLLVLALIGPDDLRHGGGGLGCFSEACVEESRLTALACFGIVAIAVTLMGLAIHSTRRSLTLATVGSFVTASALVPLLCAMGLDTALVPRAVVAATLISGAFGLGSWLRYLARGPR
jgi:hypothetical protein